MRSLGCVQRAQTAKRHVALVLKERFAIRQGDEGDGACDSYALGRVCDGEAVDHEPFTDDTTVLSKTMDYKAGHDAGFAAVCAHSCLPPSSRFSPTSQIGCVSSAFSANDMRPPPLYALPLYALWGVRAVGGVPCGEAIACMISALDHASRFRPQLTGLVAACLWFRAHIGARS